MIITVDGPAAAGKGTLSQRLAKKYNLAYFDTGMLYRAVGLELLKSNISLDNIAAAATAAENLTFAKMMALSKDKDFRSAEGGRAASVVSSYPEVRKKLLDMQQNFAKKPVFADGTPADGAIYDGRDTGTTVCPNADVKLFITASSEVRAKRRCEEFAAKGQPADYKQVLDDIKARDERDSTRKDSPMKPAADAIILDTSELSIDEVFTKVVEIISEKLK